MAGWVYWVVGDLHEPERSALISSFSGMSWMAALIFSLITFTALCHFRLQCLRSTSQSATTQSEFTSVTSVSASMLEDYRAVLAASSPATEEHIEKLVLALNVRVFVLPKSLLVCMSMGRFWMFRCSETVNTFCYLHLLLPLYLSYLTYGKDNITLNR